jgi:hypothetical protein
MPAALRLLVVVAAHPRWRRFVRFCAWPMLLLGTKPPLVHYPDFIVCLASEKLFVTDFKDLYVSLFLEKK